MRNYYKTLLFGTVFFAYMIDHGLTTMGWCNRNEEDEKMVVSTPPKRTVSPEKQSLLIKSEEECCCCLRGLFTSAKETIRVAHSQPALRGSREVRSQPALHPQLSTSSYSYYYTGGVGSGGGFNERRGYE